MRTILFFLSVSAVAPPQALHAARLGAHAQAPREDAVVTLRPGLRSTFDGGDVGWMVVLAATARNGALVEYVVIDAVDGQAEGWISRFDVDVWLVASPLNDTIGLQPFTWTAELGEAAAPMDGAVVLDPDRVGVAAEGCGCDHGGASVSAWALLAAVGVRRRRHAPAGRWPGASSEASAPRRPQFRQQ